VRYTPPFASLNINLTITGNQCRNLLLFKTPGKCERVYTLGAGGGGFAIALCEIISYPFLGAWSAGTITCSERHPTILA